MVQQNDRAYHYSRYVTANILCRNCQAFSGPCPCVSWWVSIARYVDNCEVHRHVHKSDVLSNREPDKSTSKRRCRFFKDPSWYSLVMLASMCRAVSHF